MFHLVRPTHPTTLRVFLNALEEALKKIPETGVVRSELQVPGESWKLYLCSDMPGQRGVVIERILGNITGEYDLNFGLKDHEADVETYPHQEAALTAAIDWILYKSKRPGNDYSED